VTPPTGRHELLAASILLLVFCALSLWSMHNESLTGDEVTHLPAGYSYLATGRFELNPQHPPLVKMVAAAPLLGFGLWPVEAFPEWASRAEWGFGRQFLFQNRVGPERLVFWGRIGPLLVSLVLLVALWRWARDLHGVGGGLLALCLAALAPDLLAHGHLVTTDAGVAAFLVLALWSFWRASRAGGPRWSVLAGLGLGLALAAKYLAVFFLPVFPLLLAIQWWPMGRERFGPAAARFALLFAVAYVVASAATMTPLDPRPYIAGMRQVFADRNPLFEAFLFGSYSRTGFWLYYPAALLVKLPLAILALAGWFLCARMRARRIERDELWAIVPLALYLVLGLFNSSNIGVRHVLGVEPLLFVLLGGLAPLARGRGRHGLIAALAALVLEVGARAPDFLSFFNLAVGGPRRGIFYLDDSNIDWGQDAYRLRDYVAARPRERFRIHYFGPIGPEAYGVRYESVGFDDLYLPEPGVTYVISAHYLQRSSLSNECLGVRYPWLLRYRPVEWIGGSLCVFRFAYPPPGSSAPPATLALDWKHELRRADGEYRELLQRCPGWAPAQRGHARLRSYVERG
jgi:4-amino-4-deoxy-L-arabinose transferase-like glycosyltransferase